MNRRFVFLLGSLTLCMLATAAPAADTKSDLEQALRNLDAEWAKAVAAKDLDKTVSYYSDDAIVLPANAPSVTTKDAIRNMWKGLLESPGMKLTWSVTRVEVATSGDMAYVAGTYDMTINDAGGKMVNDHGKYLEVWEKQANGGWKCGADMWNSDLPEPVPADKK